MKRKITIMLLAFFMTVGMSGFAFAYQNGYGHGRSVKRGYYKPYKYNHRPFHKFHRHPRHHRRHTVRHHTVIVEREYIPYRESSSAGTALDFGGIVLQLPELVVFD